jgi:phage gp16-like protein
MTAAVNRNRLIARLHAMKREMGLDDDLYRDKLEGLTGKRSAADLGDDGLEEAVRRFRNSCPAGAAARLPATKQARLIQAQWISLWNLGLVSDPSDAAILAFIRRQTKLDAAVWLKSHDDVVRVVEALKDWLSRDGGVEWGNEPGAPPFMRLPSFKVCAAQWRKLIAIGAMAHGRTWTGNDRRWIEGLTAYAGTVNAGQGPCAGWTNPQWARVSKALGRKLRSALEKREDAV